MGYGCMTTPPIPCNWAKLTFLFLLFTLHKHQAILMLCTNLLANFICDSKTYEYGCSLIHIYMGECLNMGAILHMTNSYGKCSNVLLLFMWNVNHGRGMPIWCYVVKYMCHAFISRRPECANIVMDPKLEHIWFTFWK